MIKKPAATTTRKPRVNKTTTEVVVEKKVSFDLLSQIKIDIKHKNETQKKLTQSIKTGDVTICTGPAGTGKSLISIATALKLLQETDNKYDKLILLKSITQLNGETLPALPGDASEKMMYQNMSFFDSLVKLIGEKITGELVNSNKIKFDVIGSYRGRSISESLIIVDECQNISHDNLKTILTRISDDTKIILLGDPEQIDIRNKKESSLATLVKKVKSNPMEGVNVVEFTEKDIIRHRLTSYFINLFKETPNDIPSKNEIIFDKTNNLKISLFGRVKLFVKSRFQM
jgi:phosphate starvation-inducible PhoH-like protein